MTVPNGAKSELAAGARGLFASEARSFWVAGAALSSLLAGSVQRRAVAWRVAGQAVRPSAEHGRPEVGLTSGAVVSADSSV